MTSCTDKTNKFLGTWQNVTDTTITFIIRKTGDNFILEGDYGKKNVAFYNKEQDKLEVSFDNSSTKVDYIYDTKTSHLLGAGEEYQKKEGVSEKDAKVTDNKFGTFKDSRDGKVYKTVKIGDQIWFAENLAYKTKSDCWAYNNDDRNIAKYGYLYYWKAAKQACPQGWHLPTEAEWSELISYLGGNNAAGGKMKATTLWNSPNTGATNESGFSALPAGSCGIGGFAKLEFCRIGELCFWWSATKNDNSIIPLVYMLNYNEATIVQTSGDSMLESYSVRCVKD